MKQYLKELRKQFKRADEMMFFCPIQYGRLSSLGSIQTTAYNIKQGLFGPVFLFLFIRRLRFVPVGRWVAECVVVGLGVAVFFCVGFGVAVFFVVFLGAEVFLVVFLGDVVFLVVSVGLGVAVSDGSGVTVTPV